MKKVLNLLFLCVCLLLIGCEKGEDIAYYTDDLLEEVTFITEYPVPAV